MTRQSQLVGIGSIVIWMLVVVTTAGLIDALGLFSSSPSIPGLVGLLGLGGLLLLLVAWFAAFFSDETGRLFG